MAGPVPCLQNCRQDRFPTLRYEPLRVLVECACFLERPGFCPGICEGAFLNRIKRHGVAKRTQPWPMRQDPVACVDSTLLVVGDRARRYTVATSRLCQPFLSKPTSRSQPNEQGTKGRFSSNNCAGFGPQNAIPHKNVCKADSNVMSVPLRYGSPGATRQGIGQPYRILGATREK